MANKVFTADEVARHTSADSCWVVLHGHVYDVTDFLPHHPGGSKIILQLAGRDATAEFDPIHPPGTLEEHLKPEAKLGAVDPESLKKLRAPPPRRGQAAAAQEPEEHRPPAPPLDALLNLDDVEAAAKTQISKKCWAYYYSAADDLCSKSLNSLAYRQILLRPRVFVDVTRGFSTEASILGGRYRLPTPLYVSPAAMARLAHPDGEAGIQRGVARFGALQIVSHNASMTPEQVAAAAPDGQILGWQLYVQTDRAKSERMLRRINALRDRYKFIVLTLDAPVPSKREHDERAGIEARLAWQPEPKPEPKPEPGPEPARASPPASSKKPDPNAGVGKQLFAGTAADLTWTSTLPWLARHTDLPVVLKGVQTHEDAFLAARCARARPDWNLAGVILSNHGGRSLDTAPPAIHTLLEIRKYCPEVLDAIDVWVDGGVRRGTDVVKALCLGAKAVGVGRAALWGLGAGGEKGVERVFEILQSEIETCMKMLGATSLSELGPRFVNTRVVERDIFDGDAGLDRSGLWEPPSKPKL
ncbi:hypothetical protein VTJ83DRAFT_5998 [Remersonia thermophila]|uniref:Uncharacterized protein n=1 Tax=Remersonia thermophila TaxID=72144 RepID=A0ABR4DA16_9PEZI